MVEYLKSTLEKLVKYDNYILIAMVFATIHTMLSPKGKVAIAYLISYFIAIPVGVLTGIYMLEHNFTEGEILVSVAIASLLSQDIIKLIMAFMGFLKLHKDSFFYAILNKIGVEESKHCNSDKDNS